MINPYEGVNWGTFQHIQSTTHMHHDAACSMMQEDGFKHLAISNYYPSKPVLDYKNIVNPKWANPDVLPDGMIGSPNAEHHNSFVDGQQYGGFHFNSLGSTWESGQEEGKTPIGVQKDWRIAFRGILDTLKYKDGGGITINHPPWTGLSLAHAIRFLDYDERVLGIEIFNAPVTDPNAWALDFWDELLKTGRRVWGFCVTDHPNKDERPFQGRSVLIVDKFTEEECLKAYREGRFYGKIYNTDLRFTELKYSDGKVTAKTNNATSMKVIVDGEETVVNASEVTYTVPDDATYVRIEAHTDGDSIFSNPFILKPRKKRGMNKLMWY